MSQLVTLQQAKDHIRVGSNAADATIATLIEAAESWLAETLGVAFSVGTFIDDLMPRKEALKPYVRPIVAVESITDLWTSDVLDAEDYRISNGRILYTPDGGAPVWWLEGDARWQVKYTAGYNDGDVVKATGSVAAPRGLRLALLDLIHRAYTNRGGIKSQASAGVSINWDELGGEIMGKLRPFMPGGGLL